MSRLSGAMRSLLFPIVVGGIIFTAAGRWDLPMVWAVLGVLAALGWALAFRGDAGMARERRAPGPGNRDRLTRPLSALFLLGHWVLTGLDVGRFEWSLVPRELQVAALAAYAAAMAIVFWAMRANRFYSSVVRVQEERGHHAVASGPYRFVRHPGYAATVAGTLSGSIALGSWLGTLPIVAFAALFVRRTLLEDRMLLEELPGYTDYARRVRYRLLPGVF